MLNFVFVFFFLKELPSWYMVQGVELKYFKDYTKI